jgi:hypothetical protein
LYIRYYDYRDSSSIASLPTPLLSLTSYPLVIYFSEY